MKRRDCGCENHKGASRCACGAMLTARNPKPGKKAARRSGRTARGGAPAH